jgi:hypothetical protein
MEASTASPPTDMVEYLSTEKLIHTQEKWVDDFHRAFG